MGSYEKPAAAAIAPAALPVKTGYAPAPVYHAAHAPVYHAAPAPVYHAAPAPVYHVPVVAAPAYHAPVGKVAPAYHAPVVAAPAYHAPVVHAAPAYHSPVVKVAPVVHAAPAYHAPAHYVEEKGAPEPYTYEYAVADDYSKAAFNAGETSDANGVVSGSYSVALP